MSDDELLEIALAAAQAAAAELLARFGSDKLAVSTKTTPTDPVSEADHAAERAIRRLLALERPGDAILGEEGGESAGESGLRWVVDPLDGTVNYLYGIPQFAVSIACEDAAGAIAGVVLNPISGECFAATRSGPATLGGIEITGSQCDTLERALIATGFAYDSGVRAAQAGVVAGLLPRVRDVRRAGAAALDLAACGAGRLDGYFERGVKAWDVAAGALICRRAGLVTRDLAPRAAGDGGPAVPGGIVAAPPALIDPLTELVA